VKTGLQLYVIAVVIVFAVETASSVAQARCFEGDSELKGAFRREALRKAFLALLGVALLALAGGAQ
jgi:hypothetical protein